MDEVAISANLRRIRHEHGLTQEEAAKAAGLSRAGYRKIESDAAQPRSQTLLRLAGVFKVPLRELVTPVPVLEHVRFRSTGRLRTRSEILTQVGIWLRNFNELERSLKSRKGGELPSLSRAQPKGAAEKARKVFGIRPDETIRDICGLLESRGIKVLALSKASDGFFGLAVAGQDGGPAVVVNAWERISVERRIFTAAHELAHIMLHPGGFDVALQAEEKREEKEANIFASHFLMPHSMFDKEWEETAGLPFVRRVLKVKRMFRVSYKTVLYRLSESSAMGRRVWARFQTEYLRQFGRSLLREDEPEALAADSFRASFPESLGAAEPDGMSEVDFAEDRLLHLVRLALERGIITLSRAAEILGLSLPDMRALAASWVS